MPSLRLSCLIVLAPAIVTCRPQVHCTGERCGTAVIVVRADADNLLPPATGQNISRAVSDLIFLKLADIGSSLNTMGDEAFTPALARSWRFRDTTTLEFSLHPEAKWHDGEPVTARDVVFTFETYRDTLVNAPAAPQLGSIVSVTAEDSLTAVFRFTRKYPEQFFDATYHMRILPAHLLDSIPSERLRTHPFGRSPVGSGPYRLSRWVTGESIELVSDSSFFLGRPGVGRLIWQINPDEATTVSRLVTGEADVADVIINPEHLERLRSTPHLRLVEYGAPVYGFVAFNFRDADNPDLPHPLFTDREIRRAVAMAVDRETLARAVLGAGTAVPVGPTTRSIWIWSDSVPQVPFDSAEARRALGRSGWRDTDGDGILDRSNRSLEFVLLVPSSSGARRRAATILQDQLQRVGISVQIEELEFNTFLERAGSGRFDAVFGTWAVDPSPRAIRESWTSEGIGGNNWGSYSSSTFDDLVERALNAPDRDTARQLWLEALTVINTDVPAIWTYEPTLTAPVHRRFENVRIRPDQWAAELWKWSVGGVR